MDNRYIPTSSALPLTAFAHSLSSDSNILSRTARLTLYQGVIEFHLGCHGDALFSPHFSKSPECCTCHRRRLVINIGGAKILGKFIFRQKILKKLPSILSKILKKLPSILSKISDDLFFSHRQLFYKIYTFNSKCTPFSLYYCLCFCFLSCLFFLNKQN